LTILRKKKTVHNLFCKEAKKPKEVKVVEEEEEADEFGGMNSMLEVNEKSDEDDCVEVSDKIVVAEQNGRC
jgi:hypothetical protein